MFFFRRLALHRFVQAHPPSRHVKPAPRALIAAYQGVLPDSLLELWRRKGLGHYGASQIALIDPEPWQAVLDEWVTSPPDDVRRVPIALTPLGTLLYYRKLTASDEDIASVDPLSKTMDVLAYSLDDFFNRFLCDRASFDSLVSPVLMQTARQEVGALAPGQVYEADQMLLSMQMLRLTKTDALAMHKRLRHAVEPPTPTDEAPRTVGDALPATHRAMFQEPSGAKGLAGLYLSSYLDWHRLLSLEPDARYRLLFWRLHEQTLARTEVRAYAGAYQVGRNSAGEDVLTLDIALRADSLGSDANDDQLVLMHADGQTLLLRETELGDIATSIGNQGTLGRSENYFRRVRLDEAWQVEPSDGRQAPPTNSLPQALQALVLAEPLLPVITHVAESPDDDSEEEGTLLCTLSLGEQDGLRMNMPLYSPPETGRGLKGWVWVMDAKACKAGIQYRRTDQDAQDPRPAVGDVLTNRRPDSNAYP